VVAQRAGHVNRGLMSEKVVVRSEPNSRRRQVILGKTQGNGFIIRTAEIHLKELTASMDERC
jgi:hypothetical protein